MAYPSEYWTPGPWNGGGNDEIPLCIGGRPAGQPGGDGGNVVCEPPSHGVRRSQKRWKGNKGLIVAAPQLLGALEDLTRRLILLDFGDDEPEMVNAVAAIRLARSTGYAKGMEVSYYKEEE